MLAMVACGAGEAPSVPGTIWVANLKGGNVLQYDLESGAFLGAFLEGADNPHRDQWDFEPSAVAVRDDTLYVANFASGDVLAFDREHGELLSVVHTNLPDGDVRIEEPCAIGLLGREVWVLGNDSRNAVALTGRHKREIGAGDPIRSAHSFALHGDEIVIGTSRTSSGGAVVEVRDAWTGERHSLVEDPDLEQATEVLLHGEELLIVDWWGDRVLAYDLQTGTRLYEVVGAGVLEEPISAAFDPLGRLWVLDAVGVHAIDMETGALTASIPGDGRMDQARNLLITTDP